MARSRSQPQVEITEDCSKTPDHSCGKDTVYCKDLRSTIVVAAKSGPGGKPSLVGNLDTQDFLQKADGEDAN